jgi:hypothetical protein
MRTKALSFILSLLFVSAVQAQTIQLPTVDGTTINGIAAQDYFGETVLATGQFSGDSTPDLMITARNYPSSSKGGYVFLVNGVNGVLPTVVNASAIGTTTTGTVFKKLVGSGSCGQNIASAGYVNADRLKDVLISCPMDITSAGVGSVKLVYGSSTFPASVDLDKIGTTTAGVSFNGISAVSVSSGDINGDKIQDFLFVSSMGDLVLYYGTANMSGIIPVNATNSVFIKVDTSKSALTANVADVDNDGFSDIIFGQNGTAGGGIIWGKSTKLVSMTLPSTFFNGVNGTKLLANVVFDKIASIDDINDDNLKDISIVGTVLYRTTKKTFVLLGSRTRVASLNLETGLTGTNGFSITGVSHLGVGGPTMSRAGDKNKDGINDFMISDALNNRVIHVYGKKVWPPTIDLQSANVIPAVGYQFVGSGYAGVSIDYVENISGGDACGIFTGVIIGAPEFGNLAGKVYIANK